MRTTQELLRELTRINKMLQEYSEKTSAALQERGNKEEKEVVDTKTSSLTETDKSIDKNNESKDEVTIVSDLMKEVVVKEDYFPCENNFPHLETNLHITYCILPESFIEPSENTTPPTNPITFCFNALAQAALATAEAAANGAKKIIYNTVGL